MIKKFFDMIIQLTISTQKKAPQYTGPYYISTYIICLVVWYRSASHLKTVGD